MVFIFSNITSNFKFIDETVGVRPEIPLPEEVCRCITDTQWWYSLYSHLKNPIVTGLGFNTPFYKTPVKITSFACCSSFPAPYITNSPTQSSIEGYNTQTQAVPLSTGLLLLLLCSHTPFSHIIAQNYSLSPALPPNHILQASSPGSAELPGPSLIPISPSTFLKQLPILSKHSDIPIRASENEQLFCWGSFLTNSVIFIESIWCNSNVLPI